ncbi:MAG: Gfo/Idh/MocA family oxidoreductase [Deltaproteobacteria bacterium]|nr:Gfo/Idh/MocA family oxidoreductase [Deltaproteobacteria bacterium]MBW2393749.1 Gfo/Idh/MocA family oxidoreductase [Deltaproteobacteria bacterium]
MADPLRIGILGAAAITPSALIKPARDVPEALAFAVAARDPGRARAFANKHSLPRVHESYDSLIDDPEVDAVYNPLPNSLHAEWTIRALEAGKAVLCEKPLASNADEAQRMAETAEKTGRPLMEAFHWRYHPLAERMRQVILSGRLGRAHHFEMDMCLPVPRPGDIRFNLALAGGSTMDMGCYCISILRFLADSEPEVVSAHAKLMGAGVDRYMRAELRFSDDRSAAFTASLLAFTPPRLRARVVGTKGEMRVTNPVAPHWFHRLTIRNEAGTTRETEPGRTSYTHQLEAFVRLVRDGIPVPTDARDAVLNMSTIDAVYTAAGLRRRG